MGNGNPGKRRNNSAFLTRTDINKLFERVGLRTPAHQLVVIFHYVKNEVQNMRSKQKVEISFLLPTRLLLILMLLFFSAGCGVIGIHEKYGQLYNYDNALKIKPGMTQEQVVALLGEPYILGQEQNGDILLKYEWREIDGRSFVFGLFVMGEKRTVAVNGGEATVILASESKTVKKVEYKIVGNVNYDRLRGGNDGKIR